VFFKLVFYLKLKFFILIYQNNKKTLENINLIFFKIKKHLKIQTQTVSNNCEKKIHLSENFFIITGTLKLKIFLKSTHKQYPSKKKKKPTLLKVSSG
jgi:hypothetical protein